MKIHHQPQGVDIVDAGGRVHIDTAAHTVRLESDQGASFELGALRASLLSSMGFVSEQLSLPLQGYDYTPVADAVSRALRSAAAAKGLHDEALEAAIGEVSATPLIFSAPFLGARYLWADAFRFRSCRVAIASAEDDWIDDDTPAAANAIVDQLGRWRDLYLAAGSSKRAINAALADFGDTLPAAALWGLRRVPLRRARKAQRHLELLGWLGALPHATELDATIALVEGASDQELEALLEHGGVLGARRRTAQQLAQLLAEGDAASSSTLLQLARSALERAGTPERARRDFPPPPIAAPLVDGISLIRNVEELRREGERMHHCVASRATACARGKAFIFHVDCAGSSATVQVDELGGVEEARGPFNRPSAAANWGKKVLGRWGVGLWSWQLPADSLVWPPLLDTPPRSRPLRSVRAIREAYDAIARERDDPLPLRDWFFTATVRAGRGEIGLALDLDRPPRVRAFDPRGRCLGDSDSLLLDVPAYWSPILGAPFAGRYERQRLGLPARRTARELAIDAAWRAPLPPLALPELQSARPIVDAASWYAAAERHLAVLEPLAARARAGEIVLFDARPNHGAVLIEVDLATRDVRVHGQPPHDRAELDRLVAGLRAWTHGLWAARLAPQRPTWTGDLRVPTGAEPLRTVEECVCVYRRLVEQRGDPDGRLAAFFERHVDAAMRGDAWLVVRDRGAGLVSVLDRRRNVIARTDELIAAG